jgi:uncharacterized protein YjbJ (UPF0337 family)
VGETYNQKPNQDMSTLIAKGNWNIAKGRMKQRLGRLIEDDLQFFEGKVDELVGRIQKRAGLEQKGIAPVACDADACNRHRE